MVNIAVAGGTGKVGRTIIEILKEQTRHRPYLLTRNVGNNDTGVPGLGVDYNDIASITRVLEENKIHTLISCVSYEGNALEVAQMNMIKAADASVTTKRFIPSGFGINYPVSSVKQLPVLAYYFAAIEELKKTNLQWTIFQNGVFLDYFAMPHIKTFLKPSPFGIDIEHREAAIPGNGDARFTVTYSSDVAKFVVGSLDLDHWPEVTRIAGDIITWNEFLRLAEEATGTKFKVAYDSIEKLERSEITELPSQVPCYSTFPKPRFQWFMAIFSKWTADESVCYIPAEQNYVFPDIKPLTVKDMLKTYWSYT